MCRLPIFPNGGNQCAGIAFIQPGLCGGSRQPLEGSGNCPLCRLLISFLGFGLVWHVNTFLVRCLSELAPCNLPIRISDNLVTLWRRQKGRKDFLSESLPI